MEGQGEMLTCPVGDMVPHYDIEGLRKYESLFTPGEPVVITEKIHGSNGRWVYVDGKLYCGSRTKFRQGSVWNEMAERYRLEEVLSAHPGLVLYDEVYGKGVQDLTYGKEKPEVLFFDAYDTSKGK
jgi:ATP-dependent RNA circularization protein (DNA/RNA ligase family)